MTSVKKMVKQAAKDVKGSVQEHVPATAEQWAEQADGVVRKALREHPVTSLFVALTVGFSLGRLIARR